MRAGDPRAAPSPAHSVLDMHSTLYAPPRLVLNSKVSTGDYLPFPIEETGSESLMDLGM